MAGAIRQRVILWLVAAVAALALVPATADAATASWAFEPASVDFGVLLPGEAAPAPAHLKLVNTGAVALAPALVTLGPTEEFRLGDNDCGVPLAPGGSCGFEVTFKPLSSGPKEATLEVSERNGTVPPAVAKLTGAGVSPTVTVTPMTIDFGTIQAGGPLRLERGATLTNQGPGDLFIDNSEFFVGGRPAGWGPLTWSASTCEPRVSLPPGGSCTVTFSFGSLDAVAAEGELRITDNAVDSPQVIHASGTATAPPPVISPPPRPPAPAATLTGIPSPRTKSRVATFTFTGNEYTTGFECRLDNAPFRHCASPARFRALKPGKHRFRVRPIGGVLVPALSYAWRVIGTPAKKHHGGRRRR
jgi:hypothetical protein